MKYMFAALVLTMASQTANAECELAYEGQTNAGGEPHGFGKKTFTNCDVYEGYWKDGQRHGQGTETLPNGYKYTGEWKEGKKQGQATIEWPQLEGRASKKSYSGGICQGYFCREGELITESGDTYVGEFHFGEYSGLGKLTKSNGDTLQGDFSRGQLTGFGIERLADGSVFAGEFVKGNRHGPGKLTKADGSVTEGVWRYGKSPEFYAAQASARREEERSALEEILAESAEARLIACDSFGFQRGTEAHAECAMQLYLDERNRELSKTETEDPKGARNQSQMATVTRQSNRAELKRLEAIQEATLREQERIRRMQQGLMMIELGNAISTGSLGTSALKNTHKAHTYTINGQIINCTTTGSVTNCY